MSTANSYGDTAMPPNVSSALPSRSTASCERRSGKPARSWRWPILAVVLGLFAHQSALAQTTSALSSLALTEDGNAITLAPVFSPTADPEQRSFTANVAFGVTQVTVAAEPATDWTVAYQGAADADGNADNDYQRDLTVGTNTITVRATQTGETPRSYTITVTRAAEVGSALSGLTLTGSETGGVTLDSPGFASGTDTLMHPLIAPIRSPRRFR